MKLSHLLALSLGLALSSAFAGECEEATYTGLYLAPGLTYTETQEGEVQISGWYDAEKTEKQGDADDLMCYAASASNLIAWWQNSSYAVDSAAPKDLDTIWATFVNSNQIYSSGGVFQCAVNWWLSGVYAPCYPQDDNTWVVAPESDPMWNRSFLSTSDFGGTEGIPVTLPNYTPNSGAFSGYYYDQYGLTKENLTDFPAEVWSYAEPTAPDTSDADGEASSTTHSTMTLGEIEIAEGEDVDSICDVDFVKILEDSPIALGLSSDDGELAHSITLWGVEFDKNGNLTTLWLTDSDDYFNQIFSVSATLDEKANKIYLGELEGEGEDAYYFTDAYKRYKDVYIGRIYALDTESALKWQLVPEPTTTTLSLLALAALATRRRRRI